MRLAVRACFFARKFLLIDLLVKMNLIETETGSRIGLKKRRTVLKGGGGWYSGALRAHIFVSVELL